MLRPPVLAHRGEPASRRSFTLRACAPPRRDELAERSEGRA
jgi:hypothetical protein